MWYLKLLAIMKTTESFSICALLHWETVQQWKQQSDWFGTCCHCSNTSSLLSSVFLCNWVWAGVDRARPCFGNGSPDSGPEVSCLCLCLSSGSLSECHTTARLDICGRQIEMQVVIVIRMIDASLLVSHEPEAGVGYTVGCTCKTFTHANTHTHSLWHRGKPVVVSAYRVSEHAEKRRQRGAVYLGHVAVEVEACNVFQWVGGVSDGAVMWDGCVGHSTLKLQGRKVDKEWDDLVCVMPRCMQQKQCAEIKGFWGHNNVRLAWTTFPREALFCVKMATIHYLNIAGRPLACLPLIYIPSPLTINSRDCCKVWVFKHRLL